jgi:hypothetical protein
MSAFDGRQVRLPRPTDAATIPSCLGNATTNPTQDFPCDVAGSARILAPDPESQSGLYSMTHECTAIKFQKISKNFLVIFFLNSSNSLTFLLTGKCRSSIVVNVKCRTLSKYMGLIRLPLNVSQRVEFPAPSAGLLSDGQTGCLPAVKFTPARPQSWRMSR